MYAQFDLAAEDGTRLVAWRNGTTDGPRVLVCNGMGVPPEAWPRLIAEGCGYQVAGWNQRGVLGSQRPADPSRIEIADHVSDALALLDALGWDDAIVVAWSLGVNVAFEMATHHPERVAGLLSVAGVPGGTFDTILAPQLVPRPLRRPLGLGIVHTGRVLGPQLNVLSRVVPRGRAFAELIRHSGVMLPIAHPADVQPWVHAFFAQDWDWYFNLAVALEKHGRIDPSVIEVPVTIVAGLFDALTSHDDVRAYAREIPHAQVHSLPGSHCLPLEYPDLMVDLIDDLAVRVQAYRAGRTYLARWARLGEDPEGSQLSVGGSPVSLLARPDHVIDLRDAVPTPRAAVPLERLGRRPRGGTGLPWWATQPAADDDVVDRAGTAPAAGLGGPC